MPTVYTVNIDDIVEDKVVLPEHVDSIYKVLTGKPDISLLEHSIRFTGSATFGNNSEIGDGNSNHSFGLSNTSIGSSSLTLGIEAETYAGNTAALAWDSFSQRTFYVRSLTTSGSNTTLTLPTKNNSSSNIKVRTVAVEYSTDGVETSGTWEHDLVFKNRRDDGSPTSSFLKNDLRWENITSPLTDSDINITFSIDSHELTANITDQRSSFTYDLHWAIFVDIVETNYDN